MPRFLDLFAGAGGLSEGFIQAGYLPVAHVEMDIAACYTLKTRAAFHWLKANGQTEIYNQYLRGEMTRDEFYDHVPQIVLDAVLNYEISSETVPEIFEKIDDLLGNEELDLIVGGPPCQAYSLAGRSRSETKMVGDKRNYLYKHYAEFLRKYQYFQLTIRHHGNTEESSCLPSLPFVEEMHEAGAVSIADTMEQLLKLLTD